MNGYILKPAKSPFTAKQLDMLARTPKGRARLKAAKEHNESCESEIDKVQAFDTNAASVQHVTDLVRKDLDATLINFVPKEC